MADTTRIQQLLKKLDNPRNEYAKNRLNKWIEESIEYAHKMEAKGHKQGHDSLRVLYICNHLCPNLVHLKRKPILPCPSYIRREPEAMEEYQQMLFEYEFENTQAEIHDAEGNIIKPGVHHTSEELQLILRYAEVPA